MRERSLLQAYVVAIAVSLGTVSCSRSELGLGEPSRSEADASSTLDASDVCEPCDAGRDSRGASDGTEPSDVGASDVLPDSSAEVGADAGGIECGAATCSSDEFCLVSTGGAPCCVPVGGNCATSADCCSGLCVPFENGAVGECCPNSGCPAAPPDAGPSCPDAGPPGYTCEPLPASCNGSLSCDCASQLCPTLAACPDGGYLYCPLL